VDHFIQEVPMNDSSKTLPAAEQGDFTTFLPRGGRIVVGVDGSPASKVALRTAAQLAELTAATIDALGVWEYPIAYAIGQGAAMGFGGESGWSPENDARKMLIATVDEVFGPHRPTGLRTPLLCGHPAKCILAQAEGASLIVVGSRGHGGFAGLMLGSVSAKCAASAPCPVLIVHARAEDRSGRP
jgi:nucleotide-binding universal stress UspA family protein